MNYDEVLEFLQERDMTMSRYERNDWDVFVRKMGVALKVPFIHITGSNGKGSTANYIYHIYKQAGYKVGFFSKPYLKKPNEMIRLNDEMIKDEDFARIFSTKERFFDKYNLSSFEILTFIAFEYFNETNPDIVVLECGMGGETDSTNLSDGRPLLSIITTVSLEHTAFLGRTTSEIARNKGGIIKPHCPVLVGRLEEEVENVLRDIAKKNESEFHMADNFHNPVNTGVFHFDYQPYTDIALSTNAIYQMSNASLAIEAIKLLNDSFPVAEEAIRKGLLSEPLPCRLEWHGNVVIDGAHNPEAVNVLMDSIVASSQGRTIRVVFASFKDKNIAVELPRIGLDAAEIILTTFDSKRARDDMDYFLYAQDYAYNEDYKAAIKSLIAEHPDDIILITGSLAFASLAREYITGELHL